MNFFAKLLLLVFVAFTFSSCLVRKSPHHKWSSRHHYKHHYKKGNNYGGRRLWVRYF